MEQLTNVIKRTPVSVACGGVAGEEFESAEHENIGNKVQIRFPWLNPPGDRDKQDELVADRFSRPPNGLELSFGQTIALTGDFYGIPEHPIIDPC